MRLMLSATLMAGFIAGTAPAQCFTAKVEPLACGAGNPVTLASQFPGEYPVLGSAFIVEAEGVGPNTSGFILIGADEVCWPLPPKFGGTLLVQPSAALKIPYVGPGRLVVRSAERPLNQRTLVRDAVGARGGAGLRAIHGPAGRDRVLPERAGGHRCRRAERADLRPGPCRRHRDRRQQRQ